MPAASTSTHLNQHTMFHEVAQVRVSHVGLPLVVHRQPRKRKTLEEGNQGTAASHAWALAVDPPESGGAVQRQASRNKGCLAFGLRLQLLLADTKLLFIHRDFLL
ncbi:hypothetical protein WJ84_01460 [Burkholderia ubonensis]|nr:hypothetical protein WJ84_01460 [Burkholderia ubonensis]KVP39909.1 hypothetical protein WJ87_06915 [Burkholderia ubonensis]